MQSILKHVCDLLMSIEDASHGLLPSSSLPQTPSNVHMNIDFLDMNIAGLKQSQSRSKALRSTLKMQHV